MPLLRRFLCCALLLPLAALSGCEMLSSDAWQRPTPYSAAPPLPPEKHEDQGGFTVLVGLPGQPTAAGVVADIGAFAQRRGFVRQSAPAASTADPSTQSSPAPANYLLGNLKLDVIYQAANLRVVASLHGFNSRLNQKFVDRFYQDFRQEYAGRYGEEASMIEDDYAPDSGSPAVGGGHSGRGRGGR